MIAPKLGENVRAVTEEKLLLGFQPCREPHRFHYPDVFERLGKKGLLKAFYQWSIARSLDSRHKGYVRRQRLIEFCEDMGIWNERTVKRWLSAGNDVLWPRPEGRNKGKNRGLVVYHTPAQILEALEGVYRRFEARLMPSDCLAYGYDYWLYCQLQGYVSHARGKPFSRKRVEEATGVSEYTQRRVGLYGERNVLIRPLVEGDNLEPDTLKENRYLHRGDELLGFLASSYDSLPVIPSDLSVDADWRGLDWFRGDCFYFWTEEEAQRAELNRYRYYVVLDPDNAITYVAAGRGKSQEAFIWVPGKDSKHWQPLKKPRTEEEAVLVQETSTYLH